jgi:hypothetical protein
MRGRLRSAAGRPCAADDIFRWPDGLPHAPWRRGISHEARRGMMRTRNGLSQDSALQIATAEPGNLQESRRFPVTGLINYEKLCRAELPPRSLRRPNVHRPPPRGTAWNDWPLGRPSPVEHATRCRPAPAAVVPSCFWHASWMGYASRETDTWAHLPRNGGRDPKVGERVAAAGTGGPPSRRGGPCDPDCAPSSWGPRSCWRP